MDIKTLYILLGLTNTLQAIALFFHYLINKKQKGTGFWAIGFSLVAFGFFLILFREQLHSAFLSVILSNLALNLGAIFLCVGISRFLENKEKKVLIYILISIFLVSFFYFTYAKNDINIRTVITSVMIIIISFSTSFVLFTKKTAKVKRSATFLSVIFLLHSLYYLIRTILNLTISPVHSLFGISQIQAITFLVQITEGILVTLGLIIMANQKALADGEEEKEHFKTLFHTSPEPVLITNVTDGTIIDVNEAFEQISGYNKDELIDNSTITKGIWKSLKDRETVIKELQKTGVCRNKEFVFNVNAGKEIFGLMTSKLISIGDKPYIISIIRDQTNLKQTERELLESEEKYRLLHESAGIGIGYYKPDGTVISYNQVAAKNMGGEPEDFNGKSIFQLFPKQEAQFYFDRITKVTLQDQPMVYEDLVTLPSGDKYFLSTFTTIKDTNKKVLGIQIVSSDVTNLKTMENTLRESEAKYRELFSTMLEGFAYHQIITNEKNDPIDYIFLEINDAFEKLTGLTREMVVGKKVSQVLPGTVSDPANWIKRYGEVALTGNSMSFESYSQDLQKWYQISVYSPKIGYFAVLFQDITERKKAEEAIFSLNNNLETRVKERTKELENSNKELESFAYSISHDLRAPLRAINGFSQLLMDKFLDTMDSEGKRMFHVIKKNTKMMDQLITDLLNMAEITRCDLHKETLDMKEMVQNVINEFDDLIKTQNIKVTVGTLPDGYGDYKLIKTVLTNFVDNAIKFTKGRKEKIITLDGFCEDKRTIYWIKDSGIGFNPQYINKLFKPFYTLHSNQEFETIGIGLALVERIIHRHGGSVWAEGEEGVGATFYFSLPLE